MSFKCQVCNEPQPTGASPVKVVTKKRNKQYPPVLNPDGTIKKLPVGWEIEKEAQCCGGCASLHPGK